MLCLFSSCAPFSTFEVGEVTKSSTLWSPAKVLMILSAVTEPDDHLGPVGSPTGKQLARVGKPG